MSSIKEALPQGEGPESHFTIIGEPKLVHRIPHFPLSEPSQDPDREKQRRIVAGVKELDVSDWRALNEFAANYFELLTDPDNMIHFTGVPNTLDEFKGDLKARGSHPLAVFNNLNEVVAFGLIKDPARGERDGELRYFVVVNNLQNVKRDHYEAGEEKEDGLDRPKGVGRQAIGAIFDWGFNNLTLDGRRRGRIDTNVLVTAGEGEMEIPNWTRMRRLLKDAGGTVVSYNDSTADVLPSGRDEEILSGDSLRQYVTREVWQTNRHKFLIQAT